MHTPSAEKLLDVWEIGQAQSSTERALRLLASVYPKQPVEALAGLSIGERDARLFQLRQSLFGSRMINTTRCPACSERLEWESEVADLLVHRLAAPADSPEEKRDPSAVKGEENILSIMVASYRISFRLPNSSDLLSLSGQGDAVKMREQLLARCLLAATTADGKPVKLAQLPEAVLQEMIQEMERADPQANLQISLTCPVCGHDWEAAFDIVSFLWTELDNWAQRMLQTVHLLARSYGWREADILAMSPTRRRLYLEMARQ